MVVVVIFIMMMLIDLKCAETTNTQAASSLCTMGNVHRSIGKEEEKKNYALFVYKY